MVNYFVAIIVHTKHFNLQCKANQTIKGYFIHEKKVVKGGKLILINKSSTPYFLLKTQVVQNPKVIASQAMIQKSVTVR